MPIAPWWAKGTLDQDQGNAVRVGLAQASRKESENYGIAIVAQQSVLKVTEEPNMGRAERVT